MKAERLRCPKCGSDLIVQRLADGKPVWAMCLGCGYEGKVDEFKELKKGEKK